MVARMRLAVAGLVREDRWSRIDGVDLEALPTVDFGPPNGRSIRPSSPD